MSINDELLAEIEAYLQQFDEQDLAPNEAVKTVVAEALSAKGVSGYGKAPWSEEELSEKIYQCIVMLDYYGYKINPSNVDKLLGLPKNSEYFAEAGARHFVKELSKEIIEKYLEAPTEGQDPQTVEHTLPLIWSTEQGSGLISPID